MSKKRIKEQIPERRPSTDTENAWGVVAAMLSIMEQLGGTRVPWPDEVSRVEAMHVNKMLESWSFKLKTKAYLQHIGRMILDDQITVPGDEPKTDNQQQNEHNDNKN